MGVNTQNIVAVLFYVTNLLIMRMSLFLVFLLGLLLNAHANAMTPQGNPNILVTKEEAIKDSLSWESYVNSLIVSAQADLNNEESITAVAAKAKVITMLIEHVKNDQEFEQSNPGMTQEDQTTLQNQQARSAEAVKADEVHWRKELLEKYQLALKNEQKEIQVIKNLPAGTKVNRSTVFPLVGPIK